MDPDFWRARWRAGEIGFNLAEAHWVLVKYGARLGLGPGVRVFVPMAGKSVDMAHLAAQGAAVTGVELVEDAVRAFFAERGIEPERSQQGPHVRYAANGVELFAGDVLTFAAPPFPAIYDRAALVALPPGPLRERYAARVRKLLAPGGRILLVAFEYDTTKRSGPPFSVDRAEVERLYAGLPIEHLETLDVIDENPRFRAQGLERVLETAYAIG